MTRVLHVLLAFALVLVLTAERPTQDPSLLDPDAIRAADVLAVNVAGEPELTGEVTVDPSGHIRMPLIGTLVVIGLTAVDAERRIRTALMDGFLTNPHVSVTVWHARAQPGFVVGAVVEDSEIVVASGTLEGQLFRSGMFHIGGLWMRVPADTEFSRWLGQGLTRTVVVTIATDATRFADQKDVRTLTGTLMHTTAPNPTPSAIGVAGGLPDGDLPTVHVMFLMDELTNTLGPITFETSDFVTMMKFDVYDNKPVSIVVELR